MLSSLFRQVLRPNHLHTYRLKSRRSSEIDFLRSLGTASDFRKLFATSTSIDLGSGPFPKNPFNADRVFGIDLCLADSVINTDLLVDQIPIENRSVHFVTAFNFIEHIPRCLIVNGQTCFPFIRIMNEVYRVLVPGGIFYSHTPAFPSLEAFTDPTHVNYITESTFQDYFCGESPNSKMYGFDGGFDIVDQVWHHDRLLTCLRKRA